MKLRNSKIRLCLEFVKGKFFAREDASPKVKMKKISVLKAIQVEP